MAVSRDKPVRKALKTDSAPADSDLSGSPARKAEILAHATEALDGQANALRWLQQPNRSLSGRSPLDVLTSGTSEEAERVDELLYGIEYGMYS
jgi:putative toxin-antitoxin system antitoxin component (TIGR02293 family)